MLFPAEELLRGKDIWVDLLDLLRYMLPVSMGFFTNPLSNLRIAWGGLSRFVIRILGSFTYSSYITIDMLQFVICKNPTDSTASCQ
jgi:hypothetical protein